MFNFQEVKNLYETLPSKSIDLKSEFLNLSTELDGGLCLEVSKKSGLTGTKIKVDHSAIKDLYNFIYNVYFKEEVLEEDQIEEEIENDISEHPKQV